MKKTVLAGVIIVLIIGVGFGAYYLGTKKSEEATNNNANQNLNTNAASNTTDSGEEKEFSASGEKINDPLYGDNFISIKIGSVAKEAERGAAFVEDDSIDSEKEYIQFQVVTSDSFPEEGSITAKGYHLENEKFEGESIALSLRRGTNVLCCYPTPQAGKYEVLFYYDNSLVKVVEMEIK